MNLEARVLSAVLNDKQIHALMEANVDALLKTHNDIWDFIRDYYDQNQSVPAVGLVKERYPSFEYMKDTGATKYHLDELRNEFLNDSVRGTLRKAAEQVQDGKPAEALVTMTVASSDITRATSMVKDLDATNIDSALAHFQQVRDLNAKGAYGILTGLRGFDVCLPSGITPGQFGVFLAYPSIGKSWMMQYFANQAWKTGKTPLIISLEMTEAEVRTRLFAIQGEGVWSHRKLSSGMVDDGDFAMWAAKKFAGKPPIHIVSTDGMDGRVTPATIGAKIDQYRPSIVFIDYLNLMDPNARVDGETQKMKALSRELKQLAQQKKVAIVAISSATPDDATDMNSVPQLGQVAWSKQIAYDADWLIAFGRQPGDNIMECVFRKNRNGPLGEFLLVVDFDHGMFVYKEYDS
jgi:replicative DNA helicase